MGTGVTSEPDNVNDSINEVKKMNDTSVFTDHLKILAEYSEKVDMGTATDDDFADFQQMLPRIIKAMQDGYYKMPEYVALTKIFYIIKEGFRVSWDWIRKHDRAISKNRLMSQTQKRLPASTHGHRKMRRRARACIRGANES